PQFWRRAIEQIDKTVMVVELSSQWRPRTSAPSSSKPTGRNVGSFAVGLEPARLDVVSAGMRCERVADLIDRAVRRFRAAPLRACARRACGRGKELCRWPPGLSASRHGPLAEGRLPRCRTDAAAVDRRAAGLLLRLQRAGGDLPEHVPGNRGSGAGRMEALRISVAR